MVRMLPVIAVASDDNYCSSLGVGQLFGTTTSG
jgi:hypothetical protein